MYIYIDTHGYIFIYVYIHTHRYICIYIYTDMYVYIQYWRQIENLWHMVSFVKQTTHPCSQEQPMQDETDEVDDRFAPEGTLKALFSRPLVFEPLVQNCCSLLVDTQTASLVELRCSLVGSSIIKATYTRL